ncbi:MAG: ABC transporter substrate-binding protein [Thermoleophilia bacterium]
MRARSWKLFLLLALAVGLGVAAAGCGGSDEAEPAAPAPAEPAPAEPAPAEPAPAEPAPAEPAPAEPAPAEPAPAEPAPAEPAAPAAPAAATGPCDPATPADGDPILIGISAAQTGALAPYDLQPGQALQMRFDEINSCGGVLGGRPITTEWIDTKSDKAQAATNAQELIDKGAVAIIGTCDFDFSAPAIEKANAASLPGMSLCASSPKVATPAIAGDFGGSMGEGSDTEGVTMAEWVAKAKPDWKRAYVFKDTSLEYSKATADYFAARWQELGGEICGTVDFVGGDATDVSAQVTELSGKVGECDFIFMGSWLPGGAIASRQIRDAGIELPITTNNSVDGTLLTDIAGPVSSFYSMASVCIPSYCSGEDNPAVQSFFDNFKAKYGADLTNSYPTRGYDLASALAAAIEAAGSTEGAAIMQSLLTLPKIDTMAGPVKFTEACHRPQPPSHVVLEWTDGKATVQERYPVESIPDIGDGSSCSGAQIPVPS